MESVKIQIEKAHLREYIVNNGLNSTSTLKVVGSLLVPFIEARPADTAPDFTSDEKTVEIQLVQPPKNRYNARGVVYVSPQNQRAYEAALDAHFTDLLFNYLDDKCRYHKIKYCIMQFCADYGLTYNTDKYELLKKRYYREREARKKMKKSLHKSVPNLSLVFLL
ncbi:MAG: hypothetical protein ACRCZB_05900 [Bacteroidales bacterium]